MEIATTNTNTNTTTSNSSLLVTGGLGYIGSHFVVEAIQEGYEPIIIDNLSNSDIDVLNCLETITGKKIKFYQADLIDCKALDNVFEKESFDSVVHFAGLKAVADSVKEPLSYYENNVVGSINLFNAMKKNNVNNIIFSSSATVYGIENEVPYVETQQKKPFNPYGRTKSIIEDILEDHCYSNKNFNAISLRYFNPIGSHSSGLIGDSPKGTPNNLLPYINRVASGEYEYLNVYGSDYDTPDGTGVRDYIHVIDLVNGHIKALNYQKENHGYEVFNLGCGKGISVLEIVNIYEKVNKVKIPYQLKPRRKGDIDKFWACSEKANFNLNWYTRFELLDMVKNAFGIETLSLDERA